MFAGCSSSTLDLRLELPSTVQWTRMYTHIHKHYIGMVGWLGRPNQYIRAFAFRFPRQHQLRAFSTTICDMMGALDSRSCGRVMLQSEVQCMPWSASSGWMRDRVAHIGRMRRRHAFDTKMGGRDERMNRMDSRKQERKKSNDCYRWSRRLVFVDGWNWIGSSCGCFQDKVKLEAYYSSAISYR